MKRRELIKNAAAFAFVGGVSTRLLPQSVLAAVMPLSSLKNIGDGATQASSGSDQSGKEHALKPPAGGTIPVAFLISDGAVLIDFAGPWEVFQDAMVPGAMDNPFHLYTVAETKKPIVASAGLKIVPEYSFDDAPAPKVIVIPAQSKPSNATLEWIRKSSKTADVTMSVCTGAFVLARTGLLAGKSATTHHNSYKLLAANFPDIKVKRGARFVEEGNLATAGGLSSGIDLALRVVERYFGRQAAEHPALSMEDQGQGGKSADSNGGYGAVRTSTPAQLGCEGCERDVDAARAMRSVYKE